MTADNVLTAASIIRCGHAPPPAGGTVTIPPASMRLKVDGNAVLSLGSTTQTEATVAACPMASQGTACINLIRLGGTAKRLTVDKKPVLLASALDAQGSGKPDTKVIAQAGQTRLTVTEERP
jgi:hypothetical protein